MLELRHVILGKAHDAGLDLLRQTIDACDLVVEDHLHAVGVQPTQQVYRDVGRDWELVPFLGVDLTPLGDLSRWKLRNR